MRLVFQLWISFWNWLHRRPQPIRVVRVPEVPDELRPNILYVESEAGNEWLAEMLCPCKCGDVLHLSLLPNDRPRWEVTEERNSTATVHPSVWRKAGCCSHFWIRRGRVHWV